MIDRSLTRIARLAWQKRVNYLSNKFFPLNLYNMDINKRFHLNNLNPLINQYPIFLWINMNTLHNMEVVMKNDKRHTSISMRKIISPKGVKITSWGLILIQLLTPLLISASSVARALNIAIWRRRRLVRNPS